MNKTTMIPNVQPRALLDDNQPDGYQESDTDWALSNWDFVMWALENHAEITTQWQQKSSTGGWYNSVLRQGGSFEAWENRSNTW